MPSKCPNDDTLREGAIQVLRNADGVGVSDVLEKPVKKV